MGVFETLQKDCLRCKRSVESALLYCQACARDYVRQLVGIEPIVNLLLARAEEWVKHLSMWSEQLSMWSEQLQSSELQFKQDCEAWLEKMKCVAEDKAVEILQSKAIEKPLDFLISNGFRESESNGRISHQPGVYVVLLQYSLDLQGECLYVGKASNICFRLRSHGWLKQYRLRSKVRIVYKTFSTADFNFDAALLNRELLFVESLFIGLLRPSLNFSNPGRD